MPKQVNVLFKPLFDDVVPPQYASEGSAGFDLVVNNFQTLYGVSSSDKDILYNDLDEITLYKGQRLLVGCGFSIALPEGYEMQVRSRSGKSLKEGLIVANSPGTIDSKIKN